MLQSIAQRKLLLLLRAGIQFSGKGADNPNEKERYGSFLFIFLSDAGHNSHQRENDRQKNPADQDGENGYHGGFNA